MAEPKPSSGAKPKPGAKGAGLKKKVGPLPLWAWVAIVGGGAAVYWFFIRGQSGGDGGELGGPELVSGSGGYSPQQAASAGAPAENGAMAGQLDPATLQALQDQLSSQIGDIRGHVTELEDAFAGSGFSLNEDKSWSGPGGGGDEGSLEDLIRQVVESMGGVQGSGGAPGESPAGVRWGGNIYTTRAGIARELGAHGVSYATWAARHPNAAASLTGAVPKPKPKPKPPPRRPTKSSPKPAKRGPVARKAPPKPPPKRKTTPKKNVKPAPKRRPAARRR